jgi:hypothetical protein
MTEAGVEGIDHNLVEVDVHGVEVAADWEHLGSGETYVGHERAENFTSPGGQLLGDRHIYIAPERLNRNERALVGEWTVKQKFAALNAANGRIVYRFHARDLHLVMGPASPGASARFRVRLDGQVPGDAHGSGVDEQGEGVVSEQRLHQLIRQPGHIADRTFEIEFLDPGVEAYAVTLG